MIQATQIRKGMLIKLNTMPYVVLNVTHLTPGNKRGIIICGLRNLETGVATERRFRSTDRIEEAAIEETKMEYLYMADNQYWFMNIENYKQVSLSTKVVGDAIKFLTPNQRLKLQFFEGRPFGLVLPKAVVLKVAETEAYLRDATASAQYKSAKLETGYVCQVPPFIKVGDKISVSTETGKYIERI